MQKQYEFYPMITNTVKTILSLVKNSDETTMINHCLLHYPMIAYPDKMVRENRLLAALIQELNRQYARWNKGGSNGGKNI